MGTSNDTTTDIRTAETASALSTEVPTFAGSPSSAAADEPVLFEWDAPVSGAHPPAANASRADPSDTDELLVDEGRAAPHEMEGAEPLPLDLPDPAAPPARPDPEPSLVLYRSAPRTGADRWVDAGLALLLRDRVRADGTRTGGAAGQHWPARHSIAGVSGLPGNVGGVLGAHRRAVGERATQPSIRRGAAHGSQETTPPAPPATPSHAGLRHPAAGLVPALALGLLAAFFGWVSAAPFWLANGVGAEGTATVTHCRQQALGDRCTGRFVADDGTFTRIVRLADLDPSDRATGSTVDARMLPGGNVAYAGPAAGLHLRWMLGFLGVLACGVGVGAATGVQRLRREGPRKVGVLWALSLGGPAVLALITLVAALL
ncbi:hypothetical protein [Cryptosporangium minutisporangium]|uniref:Uncharacterized protein n=1 Tax=Cryptosporangium minutisporangium TaxID=113569 RepID=A0ABP6TBS0_9ACTN